MRQLFVLFVIFICYIAHADTETINWYVDGNNYATTTCQTGGDIILPNTPYKYGYTFQGWNTYIPIEYLESTGTQWIDTGIVPTKNIKIDIDLQLTSIISARYVFGSWAPDKQYYLYIGNGKWQWGWSSAYITTATEANTDKHKFTLFSDHGISYIALDDNVISTAQVSSQPYGASFSIFTGIENNGVTIGIPQKIYSCKIFENDVLVRDFIPVLDSYGVPCMYDKVERKFYYNQGTGSFIAGPVI